MGLGTRRIAQRGLSRQTEGSGFHSATTLSHETRLLPRTIQGIRSRHRGACQVDRRSYPALPLRRARVIELHNTCHYVFIVDEALVVREMRKFLLEE